MSYLLHLLIYLDIYIILSLGLNLVAGYCGLMTLAHAGYFAIGCYAYAILASNGFDFIPSTSIGVAIAVLLSLAISLPSLRFKDNFFVLISLAVQALLFSIFSNWYSSGAKPMTWYNLTNGPLGLSGIPKPAILGIELDTIGHISAMATFIATFCFGICRRLALSPWCRLLQAMRDDELVTRNIGKHVRILKVQVFAISCGLAAVAGSIYACYIRYIDPAVASLDESILLLCMVIVGGVGNLRGPVIGAVVLLAIPELIRFINIPNSYAPNLRLLAYGLTLILMMHFRPQGIAGKYRLE